MLTLLNEELYSFETIFGTDRVTSKETCKISISTSNKIVRYARGSNPKNQNYHKPPMRKDGVDLSSSPQIETTTREILSVFTPSSDPTNWKGLPISLRVGESLGGQPNVSVRCLGDGNPNKANIYVLAFPFNGLIKPIPEDPKYHIYKGVISTSVRPFFFNGRRYRKVLYLVIEPHMALFNADHSHHTNSIPITLESYALFKDRETGEDKTNHETYTFTVVDSEGMYTEKWENETLDEAVVIETSQNTPLWTVFKFRPKDPSARPQSQYQQREVKKKQPDGYVQGNTYVTTNKNGIRKEVPMQQRSNRNDGFSRNSSRDGNGSYRDNDNRDNDDYYSYSKKKGNPNRGKKQRNRNNNDY